MSSNYFSQYVSDINDILDKRESRFEKSIRTFSSDRFSDCVAMEQMNEQLALGNRSELQSLFGVAAGCKNTPTIGTHPDFYNLKMGESKYQYCVSMFVDIKGSTNLALKYSLEEVRQMKDSLLSLCIHAVTIFGGHVQRLQGDGIYVQFSKADIFDNDMIINAINASSVLCQYVSTVLAESFTSRGLQPLRVKVGIDYGETSKVLWSHYGVPSCSELTATSIHVDLAAKLQARAGSNEIRIGENVQKKLDLPDEFLKTPTLSDNTDDIYIKSTMRYKQFVFKWRSYLRLFDFIKRSSINSEQLELYTPQYSIICMANKDCKSVRYFQNNNSVEKGTELEYRLLKNNRPYNKTSHENIIWEINNRGQEASVAGQQKFEHKNYRDKTTMKIDAEYLGHHYVECIIKRGQFQHNERVKFGIFIR